MCRRTGRGGGSVVRACVLHTWREGGRAVNVILDVPGGRATRQSSGERDNAVSGLRCVALRVRKARHGTQCRRQRSRQRSERRGHRIRIRQHHAHATPPGPHPPPLHRATCTRTSCAAALSSRSVTSSQCVLRRMGMTACAQAFSYAASQRQGGRWQCGVVGMRGLSQGGCSVCQGHHTL